MLLNNYILKIQFNKIHKTVINTPFDVYNTTMDLDLSKSKVIEVLFRLRGLPLNSYKLSKINSDM